MVRLIARIGPTVSALMLQPTLMNWSRMSDLGLADQLADVADRRSLHLEQVSGRFQFNERRPANGFESIKTSR
jgi:hypothetical protein